MWPLPIKKDAGACCLLHTSSKLRSLSPLFQIEFWNRRDVRYQSATEGHMQRCTLLFIAMCYSIFALPTEVSESMFLFLKPVSDYTPLHTHL